MQKSMETEDGVKSSIQLYIERSAYERKRVHRLANINRNGRKKLTEDQALDENNTRLGRIIHRYNLALKKFKARYKEADDEIKRQYPRGVADFSRLYNQSYIKARQELAATNIGLLLTTVLKLKNKGLSLEELISVGNVGLQMAAGKFNPDHKPEKYPNGIKFGTYATYWINQAVRREITLNRRFILNLPCPVFSHISEIQEAEPELHAEFGRYPTPKEIAQRLNQKSKIKFKLSPCHVKVVLKHGPALAYRLGELDGLNELDGDSDYEIAISKERPPEESIQETDSYNKVVAILSRCLEMEEFEIMKQRLDLDKKGITTLKIIGEGYGITRERVRQIEKEAKRKLKAYIMDFHPEYSEIIERCKVI